VNKLDRHTAGLRHRQDPSRAPTSAGTHLLIHEPSSLQESRTLRHSPSGKTIIFTEAKPANTRWFSVFSTA